MRRVSSDESISSYSEPEDASIFIRLLQLLVINLKQIIAKFLLFIHDLKCLKTHRKKKNLNFRLELKQLNSIESNPGSKQLKLVLDLDGTLITSSIKPWKDGD